MRIIQRVDKVHLFIGAEVIEYFYAFFRKWQNRVLSRLTCGYCAIIFDALFNRKKSKKMARPKFEVAAKDMEYQKMIQDLDMMPYSIINEDGDIIDIPVSYAHPSAIIRYSKSENGEFSVFVKNDWSI